MSGRGEDRKAEAIRDQAIAWAVRLQSDRATAADWAALSDWLEISDLHLQAFERVEAEDQSVTALADEMGREVRPPARVIALHPRHPSNTHVLRNWGFTVALAAAVCLAVIIGVRISGDGANYETAVGQARTITLKDGSRIHMDGGSRLSAHIDWRRRRVTLISGEASFDVARDSTRPFVVSVGDQAVRVVGTEFNVRYDNSQTVITVRRGVVAVSESRGAVLQQAILKKGDQLFHKVGASGISVTKVDPDLAFAWADGRRVYEDESLSTLVADLNRRYPTPIFLSPTAARQRFSGVLQMGDQNILVYRLTKLLSLKQKRTAQGIILQ